MPIYAVTIAYRDRELRDQVRPAHREYLKARFEEGSLVESGPFMDDSGALLIYDVETEARLYEIGLSVLTEPSGSTIAARRARLGKTP
jgi:uncharacterized protein YciI